MAIIKCPDCEASVSDAASFCPGCGVRIANNLKPCPHCARPIHKTDDTCPFCGESTVVFVKEIDLPTEDSNDAPEEQSIEPTEQTEETPVYIPTMDNTAEDYDSKTDSERAERERASQHKRNIITISMLFLLCILAGAYYWYRLNDMFVRERTAFEQLHRNSELSMYRSFLSAYPESQYATQVRSTLDTLEIEEKEWLRVEKSDDTLSISKYLSAYPLSRYTDLGKDLLETLYWEKRAYRNSEAGLRSYLSEYPDGEFVDEANTMLGYFATDTVSAAEVEIVKAGIEAFVSKWATTDSIKAWYKYVTNPMVKFMGKWNADLVYVSEYRKNLCPDNAKTSLTISSAPAITKIIDADKNMHYNATFTIRQRVDYASGKYFTRTYFSSASVVLSGRLTRFGMQQINSAKPDDASSTLTMQNAMPASSAGASTN